MADATWLLVGLLAGAAIAWLLAWRVTHTFRALSADALRASNEEFLRLARATLETTLKGAEGDLGKRETAIAGLVKPLQESLVKYEQALQDIEGKRQKAYGTLEESLRHLGEAQAGLQKETVALSTALRNPQARGRWGEIALRRVVELAGMTEHCDFELQTSVTGEEGRLRPDLLVRLPGGRTVVVDAKAPLSAYLDAMGAATEEARADAIALHAQQVRGHVRLLAAKEYWAAFDGSPEFVVLFIPGEAFFAAAVEHDPELLADAARMNVVLATPMTLVALLRAVALGWRQERMSMNAEEVQRLGRDLHDRLQTFTDHLAGVGSGLGKAVESYNKALGSFESRVLVAARRFPELGVADAPVEGPAPIDARPRALLTPRDADDERDGR